MWRAHGPDRLLYTHTSTLGPFSSHPLLMPRRHHEPDSSRGAYANARRCFTSPRMLCKHRPCRHAPGASHEPSACKDAIIPARQRNRLPGSRTSDPVIDAHTAIITASTSAGLFRQNPGTRALRLYPRPCGIRRLQSGNVCVGEAKVMKFRGTQVPHILLFL